MLEESEQHGLQGDSSVKELQQEARKLKRLCVEYSDAREYGKTEKDYGTQSHEAPRRRQQLSESRCTLREWGQS